MTKLTAEEVRSMRRGLEAMRRCQQESGGKLWQPSIDTLDALIRRMAGGGEGDSEYAQYFASGPEGHFFADDLTLTDKLIRQSGFDSDDWTVTDLHNPTGEPK